MTPKESGVHPRSPARHVILVVDDDPIALETTVACLEDHHDVVWTTRSEDALRWLDRRAFDVVVSDWRMPGLNGVELLTRVSQRERPIGCLLISGSLDELALEVPPQHRRFMGVLAKPFSTAQMLDRIAQLARITAMKTEVRRLRRA